MSDAFSFLYMGGASPPNLGEEYLGVRFWIYTCGLQGVSGPTPDQGNCHFSREEERKW